MRQSARLPFPAAFGLAAMLLTGACAYDDAIGYAPQGYPPGYDSGMGSGLVSQPGDLFGGQNVASIDVFVAPLAPYGQWVDSQFGRAFRPDTPQGWRPYVNGQWGENRLWVSNDPWGWATDHYGRWGFDERIGWVWVPGTEWAPSWVAFRDDPAQNVTGWAPIPPNVSYSLAYGFGTGWGYDSYASWYGPSWVWVPRGYLYQPGFGGRVLPWNYGASYWGGSRWQYQPGWGGRPALGGGTGYRPPIANGQGRPPQGGQWSGRPPQGRQWDGRPPQGGQWDGRPPQGGQWDGRPPQGGQWNNRSTQGGQWAGRPAGGLPRSDGDGPSRTGEPHRNGGDAGIPGFRAWQGQAYAASPRPAATAPPGLGRSEPSRPVTSYAPPPSFRTPPPPPPARPAPQMRIEQSHDTGHQLRPE